MPPLLSAFSTTMGTSVSNTNSAFSSPTFQAVATNMSGGADATSGSSGVSAQYVYSPSGSKIATMQGGQIVSATVLLPGGGTAVYNSSGFNYFRHTDWLGSSRLATTWNHAVYSKEAYAPFGETYNETGTPDRSFTGQDQDAAATGVYDYLFRKYDPVAMEFGYGQTLLVQLDMAAVIVPFAIHHHVERNVLLSLIFHQNIRTSDSVAFQWIFREVVLRFNEELIACVSDNPKVWDEDLFR